MQFRSLCIICEHYVPGDSLGDMYCGAFPGGIPEDVLRGGFDHRQVHPEQVDEDVLFELREGKSPDLIPYYAHETPDDWMPSRSYRGE
jgi:hypothetical protein